MTKLGKRLIAAAEEALAHARGEIELPSDIVQVPDAIDPSVIRKELKMSQAKFAKAFGINLAALKNWEQGRRQPDPMARAYLTVIAKNPNAVRTALAENG